MRTRTNASIVVAMLATLLSPWTSPTSADNDVKRSDEEQTLIVLPGASLALSRPERTGRVEATLDGGVLSPVPDAIEAPAATGDHWLTVMFRDGAGNVSPIRWIRLRVDGEAPELGWSFEPKPHVDSAGSLWLSKAVTVRVSAQDLIAGMGELSIVSGDERVRAEKAAEAILEVASSIGGPRTFDFTASDLLGNRTNERVEVFMDADPPVGQLTIEGAQIEGDDEIIVNRQAVVKARIEDGQSGLKAWTPIVDERVVDETTWEGPWKQGAYVFSALAEDWVGNETTIGPLKVVVDDEPPRIDWRVESQHHQQRDGVTYHRSPVTLLAGSTDDRAGVAGLGWSDDGDKWTEWSGPLTLTTQSVHLRAEDRVNNATTQTASWNIDDAPPVLRIRSADGREFEPGTIVPLAVNERLEAVVQDSGVGVAQLYYAYPRVPVSVPHHFVFKNRGRWLLRLEAVDALGNATRGLWTLHVGLGESSTRGDNE